MHTHTQNKARNTQQQLKMVIAGWRREREREREKNIMAVTTSSEYKKLAALSEVRGRGEIRVDRVGVV